MWPDTRDAWKRIFCGCWRDSGRLRCVATMVMGAMWAGGAVTTVRKWAILKLSTEHVQDSWNKSIFQFVHVQIHTRTCAPPHSNRRGVSLRWSEETEHLTLAEGVRRLTPSLNLRGQESDPLAQAEGSALTPSWRLRGSNLTPSVFFWCVTVYGISISVVRACTGAHEHVSGCACRAT